MVYISPHGSHVVQKQIDSQSSVVCVSFDTRLRFLANTPRRAWVSPEAKRLHGVEDIYEIRFKAEKHQFRPLGFFGPNASEFTILIWTAKKEKIYEPANAIEAADARRKQIISGKARCVPLKIDGEEFPASQ